MFKRCGNAGLYEWEPCDTFSQRSRLRFENYLLITVKPPVSGHPREIAN